LATVRFWTSSPSLRSDFNEANLAKRYAAARKRFKIEELRMKMQDPALFALFLAFYAVPVLLLAFVVPKRFTLGLLKIKGGMDRSAERALGAIAVWGALALAFAIGVAAIRMFPLLGEAVVVGSAIGALTRLGRFCGRIERRNQRISELPE
jgi:hypothetical protein